MTLTPPSEEEVNAPLRLKAEEPVTDIKPEQSQGFVPQPDEGRVVAIKSQAKSYTQELVQLNPNSPAFTERLNDINSLAKSEITRSGRSTSRLLERSIAASKKDGGDASVRVSKTLGELRNTVEDLTPRGADLSPGKKFLGLFPGGKKITRYFQKYESAQVQLNNITKALLSGQDELMKDVVALNQEKKEMWDAMLSLNEYIVLTQQLDAEISAEIERLKNAGDTQRADQLSADFLFPVRQRSQDLHTQLAVAVQGYMSMELVRKNNLELIKGVDRARTTTIFALETAVIVSQALDTQGMVLDQIDAVNSVTNSTIESTAALLRQQTGRIHQQAVNSGVSVQTLEKAFDNIFATIDEVETFKQQANESMATTINGLQEQLNRAKPKLERVIEAEKHESRMLER